jgi:hypothetical protein
VRNLFLIACLIFSTPPTLTAQILSPPAASWSLVGHVGRRGVEPEWIHYDYTLKVIDMGRDLEGTYRLVIREDNYRDFGARLEQQLYPGRVTKITGMIFRVEDQRLLVVESIKDVTP